LLGLFLLVNRYQKGDLVAKKEVYDFYMQHIGAVNNWNLVDSSAHLILGAHLYDGLESEDLLYDFATSKDLWLKRIAIVATWYYIRKNQLELTLKISKKLLSDDHDLIHKAVGWMLREVGKKDKTILVSFLDENATRMARTTLRYAIERFDDELRMNYLKMKKI
jgi:3-methyladenine DNA glycosylase AlkD